MTVEVRLFAGLRTYHPQGKYAEPFPLGVREGTTVQELMERDLGIPAAEVKQAFVNGAVRKPDHVLAEGDRVGIFPPIAGG